MKKCGGRFTSLFHLAEALVSASESDLLSIFAFGLPHENEKEVLCCYNNRKERRRVSGCYSYRKRRGLFVLLHWKRGIFGLLD